MSEEPREREGEDAGAAGIREGEEPQGTGILVQSISGFLILF